VYPVLEIVTGIPLSLVSIRRKNFKLLRDFDEIQLSISLEFGP